MFAERENPLPLPLLVEEGSSSEREATMSSRSVSVDITVRAARTMYMIARMESHAEWERLQYDPMALHVDLKDYDYLKNLELTEPRKFKSVTTSSARGYFGMIFASLWHSLDIKRRVQWSEESRAWLTDVLHHLHSYDSKLKGIDIMHLELAILYLRNSAVDKVVASRSIYYKGDLQEKMEHMRKMDDYSNLWAVLADHPFFTYSIWHRAEDDARRHYVLSDNQENRLIRIQNLI
jgi:hypothetical protein